MPPAAAAHAAAETLAAAGAAARTNYFGQPLGDGDVLVCRTVTTAVLLARELDFARLYFVTRDAADLRAIAAAAPGTCDVIVNHIHKHGEPDGSDLFPGFDRYAAYERMYNREARPRPRHDGVEYAAPGDLNALASILRGTFDRYTDHLPSPAALRTRIERREVLVRRTAGRITGFVLFAIDRGAANFNYVYNERSAGGDASALLDSFYAVLHERGVRRTFLWVDSRKAGVIRLYERFGWKDDGLRAAYYLRKP